VGACLVVAEAAYVYKWTDDQGVVHYADSPPPGHKDVEKLKIESGAPRPETPPPGKEKKEKAPTASDVNITQAEIQVKRLQKRVDHAKQVYEQARKNRSQGEKVRLGSERNYTKYLDRIDKLKQQEKQAKKQLDQLRQNLEQARSRLQKLREQKAKQDQ